MWLWVFCPHLLYPAAAVGTPTPIPTSQHPHTAPAAPHTLQFTHPSAAPSTPQPPTPNPHSFPSPPTSICSLRAPHSLTLSVGAHSSSSSSPFRGPGGNKGRKWGRGSWSLRNPLALPQGSQLYGSSPRAHTFVVLALLHGPFVICLLLLGATSLLFGFL